MCNKIDLSKPETKTNESKYAHVSISEKDVAK